jgi:predicted dithiol-disulfide oxidoreductase (DUF899 family)
VKNYEFETLEGSVSLLELFAGKSKLFAIHNMGQGCRYCALWADGINSFLQHLENEFAVVFLSRDPQKDGIALQVQGDDVQLEQVLLNLLINARQPMLGRGGSFTIRATATGESKVGEGTTFNVFLPAAG